jgi:hypothetical protein
MRAASVFVTLCFLLGGCAGYTERQSLGYGDYVAYSCDQLGEEAVRLMRETANRSEHLIEDDRARRDGAKQQLQAVKQASTDKHC